MSKKVLFTLGTAIAVVVLLGAVSLSPTSSRAGYLASLFTGADSLEKEMVSATALLYGQMDDGTLKMFCTVTAFERNKNVYHFVTAAHCVSEDDVLHDRTSVAQNNWYITFDEPTQKDFFPAKLVGVGYQHRGDDFAVLEVTLEKPVPIILLAANDPALGEDVSNIASPLGLGKQLFRGHVSMAKLDRPVIDGDINWRGTTLIQMSAGPGSSGSSVVSRAQKGIVAFLVGTIGARGSQNIVCIPVSKFRKFWTDVQAGKYKWYKDDASATASGKTTKAETIWQKLQTGFVYQVGTAETPTAPAERK